jgi:hypothetical protein
VIGTVADNSFSIFIFIVNTNVRLHMHRQGNRVMRLCATC